MSSSFPEEKSASKKRRLDSAAESKRAAQLGERKETKSSSAAADLPKRRVGLFGRLSQPLELHALRFLPLDDVAEVGLVSAGSRQLCEAFFASLKHLDLDNLYWESRGALTLALRFCCQLQTLSGTVPHSPRDAALRFEDWGHLREQYQLTWPEGGDARSVGEVAVMHLMLRNKSTLRRVPNSMLAYRTLAAVAPLLQRLETLPSEWWRHQFVDGDDARACELLRRVLRDAPDLRRLEITGDSSSVAKLGEFSSLLSRTLLLWFTSTLLALTLTLLCLCQQCGRCRSLQCDPARPTTSAWSPRVHR